MRTTSPLILAIALAAAGCGAVRDRGVQPTEAELANADYGPAPFDWEDKARDFLTTYYVDRGVFQVRVQEPRQAWYGELGSVTRRRDLRFGWAVGFRAFRLGFAALDSEVARGELFFRDGSIDAIADQDGFRFLGR